MQNKPLFGTQPDRLFCKDYGIVGRWLFNENGTSVNNIVKNKRGTLTGFNNTLSSGWVPSKSGRSLKFDAANDYVLTGDAQLAKTEITVMAWVNIAAFTLYDGIVVQREGTTAKTIFLGLRETGRLAIFIDTNGSGSCTHDNQGSVLSANTWYMVGFTFSAVTNSIVTYVNGNVSSTGTGTISGGLLPVIPDNWEFGNDKGALLRWFSGQIDQVIIADRVWAQDEVKRFYNKPWSGMIKCDTRRFSHFSTPDWAPHDPMGMLGIHGI